MHKPILFLLLGCLLSQNPLFAQPTFAEDIAPIIYENCTSCHRPGEIGPMPFTNYSQVKAYANMIKYVTEIRYMPPWSPDPEYSHFLDERVLTEAQIELIGDWVDAGSPRGDANAEPDAPTFPEGSVLGTPDTSIAMSQAFPHQGNNQDQYQVFVLPTNYATDKDIAAIEFRPGNRKVAHHALFALDTSGYAQFLDQQDPRYGYESFGGFGLEAADLNFGGWVPGVTPRFFPPGIGKKLYAGSDILLQMHYGPSAVAETDSSFINLFFSPEPVNRYLQTATVSPGELTNGPFIIPANSKPRFHAEIFSPFDVSLVSITPHMHLLGKSWEIFAVSLGGDTLPIIRIEDWDFNWQGIFSFPSLKKVPAGSTVHFYAEYDNTADNPFNPNDPPQFVTWGEGTQDEMFITFVNFVAYQQGDEDITLSNEWEEELLGHKSLRLFPVYPNPASADIKIGFQLTRPGNVSMRVLSLEGKQVQTLIRDQYYGPGHHQLDANLDQLAAGVYVVEIAGLGVNATEKVVVR